MKARLILEKLSIDGDKATAQKVMFAHVEKQTARQVEFNRRMESVKVRSVMSATPSGSFAGMRWNDEHEPSLTTG